MLRDPRPRRARRGADVAVLLGRLRRARQRAQHGRRCRTARRAATSRPPPTARPTAAIPRTAAATTSGHSFHFIEALAERGDFPCGARRGAGPRREPGRAAAHLGRLSSTTSCTRAAAARRAATRPRSSTRSCAQAWATPEALGARAAAARPHRPRVRLRRPALAARARRPDDAQSPTWPRSSAPSSTAWQAALAVRVARQRRSLPRRRSPDWKTRTRRAGVARPLARRRRARSRPSCCASSAPRPGPTPASSRRLAVLHERAEESGVGRLPHGRPGRRAACGSAPCLVTVAGREYLAHARHARRARRLRGAAAVRGPAPSRRCPFPPELQLARSRARSRPSTTTWRSPPASRPPGWASSSGRPRETARATTQARDPAPPACVAVYDGSPAQAAGLRAGDIVLGPPGTPLRRARPDSRVDDALRRRRAGRARRPARRPPDRRDAHPEALPAEVAVAARPAEGGERRAAAPARRVSRHAADGPSPAARRTSSSSGRRGAPSASRRCPRSRPSSASAHTPVVAITDEDRSRLDPFFAGHSGPFPALVATDENRQAFLAYGVSGMPTFVLVDGKGVVRGYATGYSPAKGLASRRLAVGRPACAVAGMIRQPLRSPLTRTRLGC